jgi:two-component system, LuxR family, sensor kinase FixL
MSDPTNGGRERAYKELRESEELHRATLENISDAVFLTNDQDHFTFVCPNVDIIFGYSPDEVHTMSRINVLLGDNLFDHADLVARGEIRNIERDIKAKSGARRTVLVHVKSVSISGSTVLYCCRDITEVKHAEEDLRVLRSELAHSTRLALVGQLMASITHEVKQPLTAIVANASAGLFIMARESAPYAEGLRDVFQDIIEGGRLAEDIIQRLQALARKRPLVLQTLDVNQLALDTLRFIEGDAKRRHVTTRAELETAVPVVQADRVCLQQVLLSLTLNAMDAMDQLDTGNREVLLRTRRTETGVELSVSDTGHGIAADALPKLFEPFFTTKKEGLGLGLAISRSIVEAHEGRIWAENAGRGATFHVSLPSTMRAPASAALAPK